MTALTATIGAAFAILGAALVAVALLRRRAADQPPATPTVLAGLAIAALGVIALAAATLADNDDDNDRTETAGSTSTTDDTTATADTPPDATDPERPTSTTVSRAPSPDCFDQHLARDPIVRDENRIRLQLGVNVPVSPNIATALEFADQDQVLGIMRVIHEPLDNHVHVYDVVDATCTPITTQPANTTDFVTGTTRTTIPLRINNRNYTLTIDGVINGNTYNATLTRTP